MPERFYRVTHPEGDVHLVELSLPVIVDPVDFDRLNDALGRAVQRAPSGRWVLDLSKAQYVGSALLGLLVNVRQRIKSAGGRLVLCGLSEQVDKALRTCSLHSLFTVATTRTGAIKLTQNNA